MMPLTSVSSDIETSVVLDRPNVATSVGPLGTPFWCPVASRVPVTGDRIRIPLGTDRVPTSGNDEHQRAANRCHYKCFHEVISGVLSMQEITKRAAPTNRLGLIFRKHRFRLDRRGNCAFHASTKFADLEWLVPRFTNKR